MWRHTGTVVKYCDFVLFRDVKFVVGWHYFCCSPSMSHFDLSLLKLILPICDWPHIITHLSNIFQFFLSMDHTLNGIKSDIWNTVKNEHYVLTYGNYRMYRFFADNVFFSFLPFMFANLNIFSPFIIILFAFGENCEWHQTRISWVPMTHKFYASTAKILHQGRRKPASGKNLCFWHIFSRIDSEYITSVSIVSS